MDKINRKFIVLLILGVFVHQHHAKNYAKKAVQFAQYGWTSFGVANNIHDTYSKLTSASTDDIMADAGKIITSLDNSGKNIEEMIQKSTDSVLARIPLLNAISGDIQLLNGYVGRIDELFADLKGYLENPGSYTPMEMEGLAKTFTSLAGNDVQGTLNKIKNLVIPEKMGTLKKSVFLLLAEQTKMLGLEVCDTGAPPQYRLIEFYDVIMETEKKGVAMFIIGVLIDEIRRDKDLSPTMNRGKAKFVRRAEQYVRVLGQSISMAARQFRRCDPPGGHEEGVTYHEFGGFLQATVVQEQSSELEMWDQCTEKCGGYSQPTEMYRDCKGYGCSSSELACYGRIANCQSMNYEATICKYSSAFARKYEWFKDGNNKVSGDDTNGCPGDIEHASKEFVRGNACDVCTCICVEDGYSSRSTRYVNMRDQTTDVANNMVVVGMKFVIENHVAHVQLMQGKLGPELEILEGSTVWMDPENIQYSRIKSLKAKRPVFVLQSEDGGDQVLQEVKDYVGLIWEERRFNLDTLSLPEDYVLTGVRFRRIAERDFQALQLEIQGTLFDGDTGQLDVGSTKWVNADNMLYAKKYTRLNRNKYVMKGTKNPTKSKKTVIDTKPYTYIDLNWSDLEWDAGQTTIPLLDGLPVVSNPPSPLMGVGLYHKKQTGYGGFLTFVLEGIDIGPYVPLVEFPEF